MRWCVLVALVACSSHADHTNDHAPDHAADHAADRTNDPAIGRWTGDNKRVFELRADGTLDIDPMNDRDCETQGSADPVLAACRARQTWSRTGETIVFERGALARPVGAAAGSATRPCECRLERQQLQLRGNELVAGKEHAVRIP